LAGSGIEKGGRGVIGAGAPGADFAPAQCRGLYPQTRAAKCLLPK